MIREDSCPLYNWRASLQLGASPFTRGTQYLLKGLVSQTVQLTMREISQYNIVYSDTACYHYLHFGYDAISQCIKKKHYHYDNNIYDHDTLSGCHILSQQHNQIDPENKRRILDLPRPQNILPPLVANT